MFASKVEVPLTRKYSLLTYQNLQIVMGRFSAVLEQTESLSQLAGSGIAAVVLHSVHYRNEAHGEELSDNITSSFGENQSSVVEYGHTNCAHECVDNSSCISCSDQTSTDVSMCGSNHCPYLDEHTDVLVKPSQMLLYILLGVLLGCNLLGVVSTFFLTNIKTAHEQTACRKFTGTIQLFANPRLYLMVWCFAHGSVLFAIYCGAFHQVYVLHCFRSVVVLTLALRRTDAIIVSLRHLPLQSFVSCTLGVAMVAYTFMAASASHSLTAVVSGKLVKHIPRVYHYVLGCLLSVVLGVTWIIWQPQRDQNMALLPSGHYIWGFKEPRQDTHQRYRVLL